jgi:hypothetical protein
MNLFKTDSTSPDAEGVRHMAEAPDAAGAAEFTSGSRTKRRGRVSRAFVPERKAGHPLWQWILVIAVRLVAVPLTEPLNDAALDNVSYFMLRPVEDLPKPTAALPDPIPGVGVL